MDALDLPPALARALGMRRHDELPELARRAVAAAIADPGRMVVEIGPVYVSVDEVVFAYKHRPEGPPAAQLAIIDLVNLYRCFGAPQRSSTCERIVASWLGRLADVIEPGSADGVRLGLAALAIGEMIVAHRMAGFEPGPTAPYEPASWTFDDLHQLLRHLVGAARAKAQPFHVQPALRHLVERLDAEPVDERTLLWVMRIVKHDFEASPLETVVRETRAMIDRVARERVTMAAAEIERAAARADKLAREGPDFPTGDTLAGGAFVIREHLQGGGFQQLALATETATGATALVSIDIFSSSRHDPAELRAAIDTELRGQLELAFVGRFDATSPFPERRSEQDSHWAVVERVPDGVWLPRFVAAHDPARAVQTATALGRSAGEILLKALKRDQVLVGIRPEYMFARRDRKGRAEVTGLSTRGDALFSRSRACMVTAPVFPNRYVAPEVSQTGDTRSLAYTLAVMVAEWATGHGYAPARYADYGRQPRSWTEPLGIPADLERMLRACASRDPAERPTLAELVDELGRRGYR